MPKAFLYSSQKMRRRRALWRLFLSFALVAIFVGGAIYALYLPQIKIGGIIVSGVSPASEKEIRAIADNNLSQKIARVIPTDNLLLAGVYTIKNEVAAIPRVKEASIDRRWPNTLEIDIKERAAWAVFCQSENKCFLIDEEGILFDTAPDFIGQLVFKIKDDRQPQVAIGDKAWDVGTGAYITDLKNNLEKRLKTRVTEIKLKEMGVYEARIADWRAIFDSANDLESSLNNLLISLDKIGDNAAKLDYIDLRLKNKIFYKFRS